VLIGAPLLLTTSETWFWILALSLGLFFGPAQAASRAFMARLAPEGEASAWFGLFALSGRVTGFLGPAALAAVTAATGSQRLGMATVLAFLAIGAVILATVSDESGKG
jgi:UMF1 family MFS transporter